MPNGFLFFYLISFIIYLIYLIIVKCEKFCTLFLGRSLHAKNRRKKMHVVASVVFFSDEVVPGR